MVGIGFAAIAWPAWEGNRSGYIRPVGVLNEKVTDRDRQTGWDGLPFSWSETV